MIPPFSLTLERERERTVTVHLTIVALTEQDIAAGDAIIVATYPPHTSRAVELRRYVRLEPEGWFLVLADQRPVGIGGAVCYDAFAYIGLIGVLPERQHQGIATHLMRHLLHWLATRGCPVALLDASPMGQPLYAQLGFMVDDQSEVWLAPSNFGAVRPVPTNVTILDASHLSALVAYDSPRFGADRGRVLAALLQEFPGRLLATHDATGRLTGFALAQERMIGPWVADAPADAAAILHAALMLPFSQPPNVMLPAANSDGAAVLTDAGFVRQRALSHMRLGMLLSPRTRLDHYGLASFALG